jgi:hypothetical protein
MPIQLLSPDQIRILGYLVLFLLVAPLFPFIYLVLRWRVDGSREPGVGLYGALLYFRTVALLLLLAGSANLAYGWISKTEIQPRLNRLSWGTFTGSLAFLAIQVALLKLHGPRPDLDAVRRVFAGFLMILCGLIAFTALVLFCITLFEEVEPSSTEVARRIDDLKIYGAWTLFYLAAYVVAYLLLRRGARPRG